MRDSFFYVAPKESMESILEKGILPPVEVLKLIESKELSREVLGVSYGMDSSNFPEYVSLLSDSKLLRIPAEQICLSRYKCYNHPDFMAIGYSIDLAISREDLFVESEKVKEMNADCYPGEVLYKGIIRPEHIGRPFAVRTYRF